jgi:kumamolisin
MRSKHIKGANDMSSRIPEGAGSGRRPLAGSTRGQLNARPIAGPAGIPPDPITITFVLRRRDGASLDEPLDFMRPGGALLSRTEFASFAADPTDRDAVVSFARQHGMTVVEADAMQRIVKASATVDAIENALGPCLRLFDHPDHGTIRASAQGDVMLPAELAGVVAVLGLETLPAVVSRPTKHRRPIGSLATQPTTGRPSRRAAAAEAPASDTDLDPLWPTQLPGAYVFPDADRITQTVVVVSLGGGVDVAGLHTFCERMGVPVPRLEQISVDGTPIEPKSDAALEANQQAQILAATAPGARIVVLIAANDEQGYHAAIAHAVHGPLINATVICDCYGEDEQSWTRRGRIALQLALQDAAALGITVAGATGDRGASDGHVTYPSVSQYVTAVGATSLRLDEQGRIAAETAWERNPTGKPEDETGSGGGHSSIFMAPLFQQRLGLPAGAGRQTPDLAMYGDPQPGIVVFFQDEWIAIGGASVAAPLFSALIVRINALRGARGALGWLNPALYAHPEMFNDITEGDKRAHTGADTTTGLGSPRGERFAAVLTVL